MGTIINSIIAGGGTTPTGTKSITANGVYDVTNFASADVQVPTTAPNPPADAEILETMDILTAEDGYEFIRTADGEHLGSSIWLHNGDVAENYIEAKLPETQE